LRWIQQGHKRSTAYPEQAMGCDQRPFQRVGARCIGGDRVVSVLGNQPKPVQRAPGVDGNDRNMHGRGQRPAAADQSALLPERFDVLAAGHLNTGGVSLVAQFTDLRNDVELSRYGLVKGQVPSVVDVEHITVQKSAVTVPGLYRPVLELQKPQPYLDGRQIRRL